MWARYAGSMAIAPGAQAPPVDGLTNDGPRALVFFKVTCSTTHLATPAIERLARAYPWIVFGVGQDDRAALDSFAETFGLSMPLVSDLEPYVASDAYGIESAPTAVAIGADGAVLDVAQSWDRAAWNRLSAALAAAAGAPAAVVSEPGDGLPEFKPG
jgi:hypothetical protein